MMEPGDKCICQHEEWCNAFGTGATTHLTMGMRLTVADTRNIGGVRFFSFKETPEDHFFMWDGFKPLRSLN